MQCWTLLQLFAYTAILGLPCEEIQQRRERLSHETKAHPEDHIACDFALYPFPLLHHICERNERNLYHHAGKCDADDVVCWDTDEELVKHAGEEEDDDLC